MKEQFVPYEQALKLNELGFDEECFTYFKNGIIDLDDEGILEIYKNYDAHNDIDEYISSPLWQQAFDWFREEHNMSGEVFLYGTPYGFAYGIYNTIKTEINDVSDIIGNFKEARLECLKKLIELCEM